MTLPLALRFALREMRGGLRGFRIFLACLALGVATTAGVGSLTAAIEAGLVKDGRAILGGDIEARLSFRPATDAELAWLQQQGRVSTVAQMRVMAAAGDRRLLVEAKAVDDAYPLYGAPELDGATDLAAVLAGDGIAVDPTLLPRLGAALGDRLRIGEAELTIRALVRAEPDRAGEGLTLGPRVLMSLDSLQRTGLVVPGSFINYEYRVATPQGSDAAAIARAATAAFPDSGWRVRDWRNGNPGLQRFIERIGLFLVLIGLTALLVGGVGVGNAVKSYLDGKTGTIAMLKCIGAESGTIVRVYLWQVMLLAGIGVAFGLTIGVFVPALLAWLVGTVLPVPIRFGLHPLPLVLAAIYGLLTALAFALWPLAQARETAPAGLFRDLVAPQRRWPRPAYIAATAAAFLALAAVAVLTAPEKRFAIWFVLGAGGAFILLRGAAEVVRVMARRAGRPHSAPLRLGLGNITRPGAATNGVVLSLGLGLTLLVAVALIEGSLRRSVEERLPDRAPSFFFVDVQNDQVEGFEGAIRAVAGSGEIQRVPSLRGRITRVNGVPADQAPVAPDQRWVLRGDRGITYAATPPPNSTVIAGQWWPQDYAGPPLISLDAGAAEGMGVKIGDTLTVNVLGREIEGRIANLRRIEWGTFALNFVLVFSPEPLRFAPHTHLATVKADGLAAEEAIFNAVVTRFPNVSAIRVREALETVNGLLGNLAIAIRGAAGVTLVAGVLVLGGALVAGRRQRLRDTVILKVLGATRRDLLLAQLAEYALLGAATALVATVLGLVAAWVVVEQLMRLDFAPSLAGAALVAVLGVVATVTIGLLATWRTLSVRPAPILRHL